MNKIIKSIFILLAIAASIIGICGRDFLNTLPEMNILESVFSEELIELIKNWGIYLQISFYISCIFFLGLFVIDKKTYEKSRISILCAAILSLLLVIGYMFELYDSFYFDFKSISIYTLMLIGFYFLFQYMLDRIYAFYTQKKIYKIRTDRFGLFYDKHIFLVSFLLILIFWLPIIIAYYPIVLSPDPSFQIRQFFGIKTKYMDWVKLIDPNVTITNHHPVLHTVILGGLAKLGVQSGSINRGLFVYSIIQTISFSSVLSYSIYYLNKLKMPRKFRYMILAVYCIVPIFPFYAINANKDTFFAMLIMLYIIFLHKIISNKNLSIKELASLFFIVLLISLFRNNGVYLIMLSAPFAIAAIHFKKKLIIVFLGGIIGFFCINSGLYPALGISSGSVREVMSIPFQQTARFMKNYPEEVSAEEYKAIDEILDAGTLAERYDSHISDPVKNEFNKNATNKQIKTYLNVWLKQFFKHPKLYLESFISNTYGYYDPNETSFYIYTKFDKRLVDSGYDYHYNNMERLRQYEFYWGNSFVYLPVIGLSINVGFNFFIIIACLSILLRKKKKILVLIPQLVLWLTCLAGPANTYFRYVLPSIISTPLVLLLVMHIVQKKETSGPVHGS